MSIVSRIEAEIPETHQDNLPWGEYVSIVLQEHGEVRVVTEYSPQRRQRQPASFYLLSDSLSVGAFIELGEHLLAWLRPSTMRFRNRETTTPHGVRCDLLWDICLEDRHWFSIWGVTPEQYRAFQPSG